MRTSTTCLQAVAIPRISELSRVGNFEQYFPKSTPWVTIRGIDMRFDEADVKDALREKLDDAENEVNECLRKYN